MNRRARLAHVRAQIERVKDEIDAIPGFPYDSPEDQKARRDVLRAALREGDKYRNPGRRPAVPKVTQRARCAECGSPNLIAVRPESRRPERTAA